MWYTMDGADDIMLPKDTSAPFRQEDEMKSVQIESGGVSRSLKLPLPQEVRLRHGLFVTLATDTREVRFSLGSHRLPN